MERLPPHIMLRKTLRELPTKSGEGECVITEFLVGFVCLQLRNYMQTELFRKSYLYAGLLPPRKLGTFLPEEGFLESHLLSKMTKVKFSNRLYRQAAAAIRRFLRFFVCNKEVFQLIRGLRCPLHGFETVCFQVFQFEFSYRKLFDELQSHIPICRLQVLRKITVRVVEA